MALTQTTAASVSLATSSYDTTFYNTTSVTVASGETMLMVRIVGPATQPSGVLFNSVALTSVASQGDGNTRGVSVWELENPSVGTYTLRVEATADRTYRLLVTTLNGNGDAVVRGTAVSASGFNTTPTVTVTTVASDLVFDVGNTIASPTVGAGQTQQMNVDTYSVGSLETASGTSTVMSWSMSSERWCIAAVPYRVTASGPDAATLAAYRKNILRMVD